jgi:hypothetical protein
MLTSEEAQEMELAGSEFRRLVHREDFGPNIIHPPVPG